MKLFKDLTLKFESPNWSRNLELGLIDTILEQHPRLIAILQEDIMKGQKACVFGRKDTPSVEQIVRAAIYKELKGLDYRELEFSQIDSRICALFIKIDELRPYSFQVYQKYISQVKSENLQKLLVELNKIAINEGLETVEKIRQDSTVIESNIHHPTNNSLIWDCIKEAYRLLEHLREEVETLNYIDYSKQAKKTFFKINVTKGDKRKALFHNQLILFTKTINQVSNVIKKKFNCNFEAILLISQLEEHLKIMELIYDISYRKEIKGETVPNSEKIFSIYERHTDIIVKGSRDVQFGHKVDLVSGKSSLILHCDICSGNRSDTSLFSGALNKIIENYRKIPRDYVADGGYAALANQNYAVEKGVKNIVFNKIVGSLKNIVSSKNMETRLKKWRSGAESVISNLKRGFDIRRCNWKGWEHFEAKVLWSVIAYNIRVMTVRTIESV